MCVSWWGKPDCGSLTSPTMRNYQEGTNPTIDLIPGKISSQFLKYLRVSIRPPSVGSSFHEKLLETVNHVKTHMEQIPVILDTSFITARNFTEGARLTSKLSDNKHLGRRINEPKSDGPAKFAPERVS